MGPGHMISSFILLSGILQLGNGGDINIGYAPSSLRFGQASTLSLSDLDDVIAASLGYTTSNVLWQGLTVTSPFNHPKAAVIVNIENNGAIVDREGPSYSVREDVPLATMMRILSSKLKSQAQRPLKFQDAQVSNSVQHDSSMLKAVHLDITKQQDQKFLTEMKNLPNVAAKVKSESVQSHGGQDVVFVTVESFSPLIEIYGSNSSQVKEATNILRNSLSQLIDRLRTNYDDSLLFASVMTDIKHRPHIREKRAFTDKEEESLDVNLSMGYDENYPVIFNIMLFFSIAMVLTIIAASMSMAYMDPGRDSIIYRMTNPRMKKD